MTIMQAAVLLFFVIDPFGNIPFFAATLKNVDSRKHRPIIARELLIALAVLVGFLFVGRYLLELLHISEPALTISGGAILFIISIRMIFAPKQGVFAEEVGEEPLIVPLAIPYVAGPSAIASVMIIMNQEPGRWKEWLLALLLAWLFSALVMMLSDFFLRALGGKVLTAMERLMGMLLAAISIQMLLTGILAYARLFAS
ncbi:MAG: MarC family protein [Planctomycetota bacterium]